MYRDFNRGRDEGSWDRSGISTCFLLALAPLLVLLLLFWAFSEMTSP